MASQEGCRDAGDTRAGAGLAWWERGGSAAAYTGLPLQLTSGRSFALLCVAAQGAGIPVPRWSWTMATACRWVSREPAENA